MTSASGLLLSLILVLSAPANEAGECSLAIAQPQVCVKSSLLITIRCRNETKAPWEWVEPNDRRATWELTRPDQQAVRTSASRYTMSSELISVAPGHELNLSLPVTRWFALPSPGSYRLRFSLPSAFETNEIGFNVTPCTDDAILAACRSFLNGQHKDLEAIAGFDSAAAVTCMQEALAHQSEFSVSIIDGLARIQSPAAVDVLLKQFEIGNAFDRLGVWQALHRIDTSKLSDELQKRVAKVLKEQPITLKE